MLTTHYLEEAEELADKVAIMDKGKIITSGTPNEIIARYGNVERDSLEDVFVKLVGEQDATQAG
jgi:ABC-2 type transport system ATP-binding protein